MCNVAGDAARLRDGQKGHKVFECASGCSMTGLASVGGAINRTHSLGRWVTRSHLFLAGGSKVAQVVTQWCGRTAGENKNLPEGASLESPRGSPVTTMSL